MIIAIAHRVMLPGIEWSEGWLIPLPPDESGQWYVLGCDGSGSFFDSPADVRDFAVSMLDVAEDGEDPSPTGEEQATHDAYMALAALMDEMLAAAS